MNQEETLINVIIHQVSKYEEKEHSFIATITQIIHRKKPRRPRDRRAQPTVKFDFLCSLPQTGSISS